MIIDAVGVCEHAMSDTHSLNRTPGESFKSLMQATVEGRATQDQLESLAYKLSRLDRILDDESKEEITRATGGQTIQAITNRILDGIDADKHIERAKKDFKTDSPTVKTDSTISVQV